MNIVCIDCPYAKKIEALGHKVLSPDFTPGVIYLPSILQMHDFKPDLVIQYERLSARTFMGGMEKMPCPTVFVSVDSHLNMFWHKYYAKLFDMVLTPHVSLFNNLPKDERLPQVRRFGPGGYRQLFKKFEVRQHDISFAGVLTEHRPARAAMVQLLTEKTDLYSPTKLLPHGGMLELFSDTRMIPNESIAREVNFRLFEAASCGCLVLSQNLGEDQNAHFEPGVEFETYDNALELLDKVQFYKKNQAVAADIGRAAWERVQSEHLPEHKAAQLVSAVHATRRRVEGAEADTNFWLTLAQMARNGTHQLPVQWFVENHRHYDKAGLVAGMKLRLLMEGSHRGNTLYSHEFAGRYKGEAVELIRSLLKTGDYSDSLECNLAGAMASLVLERSSWAKKFWNRQFDSLKEQGSAAAFVARENMDTPYGHYMTWARLLMALGRDAQVGFNFRTGLGILPGSAFECLVMAQTEANPDQDAWLMEMHKICARVSGFSYWDMGLLAEISLKYPDRWMHQLQYGLSSVTNYRIEAGIFELVEARKKAEKSGEIEYFNTVLEAAPSSGYILSALMKG